MIFNSIILASAGALDGLAVSFAYGTKKITIPLVSNLVISLVCTAVFAMAMLVGAGVRTFMSDSLATGLSFAILFFLGAIKLFDSAIKARIKRTNNSEKEKSQREFAFRLLNFRFILNVYADPPEADVDDSKSISPSEAVGLAAALSLDGIALGVGAALTVVSIPLTIAVAMAANFAAIAFGSRIGGYFARKSSRDLGWIAGVILIGVAILQLV